MHLGVVAIDEMVENTRIYTVEFGFSFMDPRESQISDACLEMVWARTIGYGPGIGWSHITELSFLFQDDGILVIPTIATITA